MRSALASSNSGLPLPKSRQVRGSHASMFSLMDRTSKTSGDSCPHHECWRRLLGLNIPVEDLLSALQRIGEDLSVSLDFTIHRGFK